MELLKLLFKSKEDVEKDRRELTNAAYPYGQAQAEKIRSLLKALLPEEPENLAQTIFLLVKRAYQKDMEYPEPEELPLRRRLPGTFRTLDRQLFGRHRQKQARYLALVVADSQIGPDLCYPEVEELGREAEKLEPACRKKETKR